MPDRDRMEQLDQVIDAVLMGAPAMRGDPELEALTAIASDLRDLPSDDFKTALKTDLQRRTVMTASTSAPVGFRTITPFLIHAQAPDLVEFIKHTFQAEELKRKASAQANDFYSEVRLGDSIVMIAGGAAAQWGNLSSALHVYVDDCDAAYRRALEVGAVTLLGARGEPADRPYGERSAFVRDAFGNYWYIATRLGPTAIRESDASVIPYVHPENAREYITFLQRAFGAKQEALYEDSGRVMHAVARVGDATLELGEPEDRVGLPTNGFFLFVDDVDAAYNRAVSAGATTVRPPADIPYGMRSGIVKDPAGYFWWSARWLR